MSKLNLYSFLASPRTPNSKIISLKPKSEKKEHFTSKLNSSNLSTRTSKESMIQISSFQIQEQLLKEPKILCSSCQDVYAEIICQICGNAPFCQSCFQKLHSSKKFMMHKGFCKKITNNLNKSSTYQQSEAQKQEVVCRTKNKQKSKFKDCKQNKSHIQSIEFTQINKPISLINKCINAAEWETNLLRIQKKYDQIQQYIKDEYKKIKDRIQAMQLTMVGTLRNNRQEQIDLITKMNDFSVRNHENSKFTLPNDKKNSKVYEKQFMDQSLIIQRLKPGFTEIKNILNKFSIEICESEYYKKVLKDNKDLKISFVYEIDCMNVSSILSQSKLANRKKQKKNCSLICSNEGNSIDYSFSKSKQDEYKSKSKVLAINKSKYDMVKKVKSETLLEDRDIIEQGLKWPKRKKEQKKDII